MTFGLFPEVEARYREGITLICDAFADVTEWHGGPGAGGGTRASWNPQHDALYLLLAACEAARHFDWQAGRAHLAQDADALKERQTAANAAQRLARYLREYPEQANDPVMLAAIRAGATLRPKLDISTAGGHPTAPHLPDATAELLSRVLDFLAEALGRNHLAAKAGPMLYRFVYGPLLFAKPLDSTQRRGHFPDERQAHFAYLIFLLFKLTDGSRGCWQSGEPMPSGRPPKAHADIAAALVRATFDEPEFDQNDTALDTLAKFLRRNPNLAFVGYS